MIHNEYREPEIYHAEYGKYEGDLSFFLNIKTSGSALDLACGTGRIARSLATQGLDVTGVDSNKAMINFAKNLKPTLPISYIKADLRSFSLNRKFDLITLAGNSFQALLKQNDQIDFLNCLKSHLKPDGVFAFNTRTPMAETLNTTSDFVFWHSFIDLSGTKVKVYGKQKYDKKLKIMTFFTKRVWPNHEKITRVKLKFTHPDEIFSILKKRGLEVDEVYSSSDKYPFHENSKELYALCSHHYP